MSTDFPGTGIDDFTNVTPGTTEGTSSKVGVAVGSRTLSGYINDHNDAIEAIQAKVGVDSSAVNTTHDFKLDGVSTGDKAASLTGTETLTNKTLTSPTINAGTLTGAITADGITSISFEDSAFKIIDEGDNTKVAQFQASGITTATTRTLTIPDANTTLVGHDTTQTLTNKAIDADNNTLSNIEVDNFKASAIVTESETIGSNDNDTTIPTSAAVKAYADSTTAGVLLSVDAAQKALPSSDSTDQNLFSTTVTGGTLSGGVIKIKIYISAYTDDGNSFDLKLKYGSTTLATIVLDPEKNAALSNGWIEAVITGTADSTQEGIISIDMRDTGESTSGSELPRFFDQQYGSASEDSTGNLTIAVAVNSSASSTNTITTELAHAEILTS